MNLRRLEYFVVLAKELHFGRAAERLHLAQPGLSQQIKVFEKECGVKLFERNSHGVTLTEAGRVLLEEGQAILDQVERTLTRVRASGDGRAGTLRIVLTRSVAFGLPDTLVNEFSERYPGVEVTRDVAWTARNVEMLRAGDVDAAFVRLPLDNEPDIDVLRLGDTEAVVVCPVDHRLAAKHRIERGDLSGETLISWPRAQAPGYFDEMQRDIFGDDPPTSIVWEPDPEHLMAAVDGNRGVAVVDSERASTLRSDKVVIRKFAPPVPRFGFGVAWQHRRDEPVLVSFVRMCRERRDDIGNH
ncbi:LysR family transcriptional regulator [Rhodococcoides trifolii]|uniref:LysR family transcriptional regulator n=1 Tax=Rhodococcoides trifolii TaxID=908250 RepID=A0A917G7S6_9NOCA|nr:LysR family transcriptional regulator [Rhodococcus trifolii]GGG27257.1 LysR family transcriptional regulator [Rhodococcus trifolii]